MNPAIKSILSRYIAGASVEELPVTEPGNPMRIEYISKLADDGSIVLEPGNEISLYDEIQSHRDSTDMNLIVSRYLNGDTSVLQRVQGVYADVSNIPQNMHDALSLVLSAQDEFARLPKEVREKFGFDSNKYISTMGSPEWLEAMKLSAPAPASSEGVAE